MKRNIIQIDQEKCNGCGLCENACHEGAIKIIDGKAQLISEEYCDGLGACLPVCPTGALKIIEAEAKPFNQELIGKNQKQQYEHAHMCPSSRERIIKRDNLNADGKDNDQSFYENNQNVSYLGNWPVQFSLVNPYASFLENADILIAADCTAFAYSQIHNKFMKNKVTIIGCPKLDNAEYYIDKLTEILSNHDIKSITVLRMEVPCCGGMTHIVKQAMLKAQKIVQFNEVIITIDGGIK